MVRKKLDARIRTLIERSVVTGQRSMLVLVGDHGKDQVPNLHQLLARTSVKARPKVLWCYKKELGFSTHRMKERVQRPVDKFVSACEILRVGHWREAQTCLCICNICASQSISRHDEYYSEGLTVLKMPGIPTEDQNNNNPIPKFLSDERSMIHT